MTGRLDGRVAAITGGASGMGRAMALRFLAEGASVVVADYNNESLASFVTEAAAAGYGDDRMRTLHVDVSVEADVVAMVELASKTFGALDILCNNAGIGGAFGPLTELSVDDWDETFHVLVRGVFLGCKHGARQMLLQGGGGSIINTASVAGITGGAGPLAYSAAKAAVVNLTRCAALELAPHRIRVNAICPGAIDTPLLRQGRRGRDISATPTQPLPGIGQPEDIAGAAMFLASDDSGFVTGEALVVDGGLLASGPSAWGITGTSPQRWVGINRGTTGQGPTVRARG